jgi:hypothetical protein
VSLDFYIGFALGILAIALPRYIGKNAHARHARYRMRAKLARAVMAGTLKDVHVTKTGRLRVH